MSHWGRVLTQYIKLELYLIEDAGYESHSFIEKTYVVGTHEKCYSWGAANEYQHKYIFMKK